MVRVPLKRMNLFTGINGRGKSTVLQALLLMRQSLEYSRATTQLTFNGSSVELGSFSDVKNSATSPSLPLEFMFTFDVGAGTVKAHYFFRENPEDDLAADLSRMDTHLNVKGKSFESSVSEKDGRFVACIDGVEFPVSIEKFMISRIDAENHKERVVDFLKTRSDFEKIHYVSANRIGPRDFYPRQSTFEFPNVGARGEYTANILSLSKKKQQTVSEVLVEDDSAPHTVLGQTEAWLEKIFDGGKIEIKNVDANIVVMQMNSERTSTVYKPLNVGFGYSYALPIIVSGLIAAKGEMLIVENPEAHLHPYAQAQIAGFLAQVSKNGVQVVIESHSDHILNGLRVAVHKQILDANDLNVLYFQRDERQPVVNIPVEKDGAINDWPPGFFDQLDKDFEVLFGV